MEKKTMTGRDEKLDLIRGLSALLVLMGHARNFLMIDATEIASPSLLTKGFYFLTSLHHPAVMVFFVLSGYFVGGSVLGNLKAHRFSWSNYGLARLSRLWVVLVPALLLTLALDLTGKHFFGIAYDGGLHEQFNSGPGMNEPAQHGSMVFLGNLFFLQQIATSVFGTNGPLCSLAYEFWYYVLFPLIACVIFDKKATMILRLCFMAAFGSLLWLLPWPLVCSGAIWLMGVGVWAVSRNLRVREVASGRAWRVAGMGLFAAALLGAKMGITPAPDFVVAGTFALWMPSLLGSWKRQGWYQRLSFGLSEISFSTYIIHFPFMFLLASTILRGKLFHPGVEGIAWFILINLMSLLISGLFWWLFESRTSAVRQWMKERVSGQPSSAAKSLSV